MSARNCPIALYDCLGVDSPITGISSEDGDPVLYYARCTLVVDPYAPPPLTNSILLRSGYSEIVYAASTQAEADAVASANCQTVSPFLNVYSSQSVTVTLPCSIPDYLTDENGNYITDDQGNKIIVGPGSTVTNMSLTLPAGYVTGLPGQTQEQVDAEATAIATTQLEAQMAAAGCQS